MSVSVTILSHIFQIYYDYHLAIFTSSPGVGYGPSDPVRVLFVLSPHLQLDAAARACSDGAADPKSDEAADKILGRSPSS